MVRYQQRRQSSDSSRHSGGSSYETTEAEPNLSFWENAFFFSENEIKFVSSYMSVIIRGECLAH